LTREGDLGDRRDRLDRSPLPRFAVKAAANRAARAVLYDVTMRRWIDVTGSLLLAACVGCGGDGTASASDTAAGGASGGGDGGGNGVGGSAGSGVGIGGGVGHGVGGGSGASAGGAGKDGGGSGGENGVGGGAGKGGGGGGAGKGSGGAGGAATAGASGASGVTASAGAAGSANCAKYFGSGATSAWAKPATGGLDYATTAKGDRLIDFSHAGYMGGGVPLPSVPVASMVSPSGKDDTAAIQAAIDAVSKKPLVAGVRGAVLLSAGKFSVGGTLTIAASGVVLRGSGSGRVTGAPVTEITITGAPTAPDQFFVHVAGTGAVTTSGNAAPMTDAYVPSGATSFHVDDASGLAVGDAIVVDRPVTAEWVAFMGMDKLVRNGMPETWIGVGKKSRAERTIAAIAGKQITVTVPLSDSFDKKYLTGSITKSSFAGRIANVGVESLRVVAPVVATSIDQPHFLFASLEALEDGWVRDVVAHDFVGAGGSGSLIIAGSSRRVTVDGVDMTHTFAVDKSAGYPEDFGIKGAQILITRSSSAGDHLFSLATFTLVTGPNAVVDFTAKGDATNLAPHERWATGLLVDRTTVTGGGIQFMDRGYLGSGHGWTMGWGVVWNSTADTYLIQAPPGSTNWCVGCTGKQTTDVEPGGNGTVLPSGIINAAGAPVVPSSLYLAQLCDRLGPAAVAAIGY
jgi:hypothetical protein